MYAFRAAHRERDATVAGRRPRRRRAGHRVAARGQRGRRSPRASCASWSIPISSRFSTRPISIRPRICRTRPRSRNSILNFGFPDLARRSIDENGVAAIAQRDRDGAAATSSRGSSRGSIKARRDDTVSPDELRVRFLVSAELQDAAGRTFRCEFVAEVELDSGKIKIDRL